MSKNKKNIVLIPSGGTNLTSVRDAIEELGYQILVSSKKHDILEADKVILPGVGATQHAMHQLYKLDLAQFIYNLKQDVLGICLGMQLLFNSSEEDKQDCLNIIDEGIIRIPSNLVVPHMGWNELTLHQVSHPLFYKINPNDFVYFAHSYYAPIYTAYTLASTFYEETAISAVVQHNNFYGMQFHPERSGMKGLQLLDNFLQL